MWIALSLIVMAAAYRLLAVWIDVLPNVAPLMALAFCGAVYLPKRWALIVPLGALLISDLALNAHYGFPLFNWFLLVSAACYALAAGLGLWAARGKSWPRLIGGSLAGSAVFFLATNTLAWLQEPGYAKTLAGLGQSLTVGLPGYPPTWIFFRNSLLSDLAFTVIFVLCMELGRRWAARPEGAALDRSAALS